MIRIAEDNCENFLGEGIMDLLLPNKLKDEDKDVREDESCENIIGEGITGL